MLVSSSKVRNTVRDSFITRQGMFLVVGGKLILLMELEDSYYTMAISLLADGRKVIISLSTVSASDKKNEFHPSEYTVVMLIDNSSKINAIHM